MNLPQRKYDLVLRGGRVFDPSQKLDRTADVAILDGKIAAIEPSIDAERYKRSINMEGLLVCPGMIDLHVHCNMFRNPEALDPNFTGVYSGVTRIVDPGDSGAYTYAAFKRNVVDKSFTKIHSWLNAAALGGFMFGLYNTDCILQPAMLDVNAAINVINAHQEHIRGIKSYSAPEGWGTHDGTEIYRKVFEIADKAHVPIYIHCGSPSVDGDVCYGQQPMLFGKQVTREEALTAMLERMRPGDIAAHIYSTFAGIAYVLKEKRLARGAREAYERGVLFDSGRGAHYSYTSVRDLLDLGVLPSTISSDRHAADQHDEWTRTSNTGLCQHMSEFLHFGMSLDDVILRTTYMPAKALRLTHEAGSLKVGRPADISVLILRDGKWTLRDNPYAFGDPQFIQVKQLLSPVITVVDGRVYHCNPAFLPDQCELQMQEDVWGWMKGRPERPWAWGKPED